MNRPTLFLTLLSILFTALSCLSDKAGKEAEMRVAVTEVAVGHMDRTEQVSDENQHPFSAAHISAGQAHYAFGTRNFRSLSFHGSHSGRNLGSGRAGQTLRLCLHPFTQLYQSVLSNPAGAASPRSYYVIALRRILC